MHRAYDGLGVCQAQSHSAAAIARDRQVHFWVRLDRGRQVLLGNCPVLPVLAQYPTRVAAKPSRLLSECLLNLSLNKDVQITVKKIILGRNTLQNFYQVSSRQAGPSTRSTHMD